MERRVIATLLLVAFSPFLLTGIILLLSSGLNRQGEAENSQIDWTAIAACLPPGITFQDRVYREGKERTISDVLKDVGANCREGKIYDASGKELHFFNISPSGHRMGDREYTQWQRRNREELEKLRKVYRVIEVNQGKE